MQFTAPFALIASLAIPALSAPASEPIQLIVPLVFDTMYDNTSGSFSSTSCPLPLSTFGQVPGYPHIGGSFLAEGFNSTQCGSCWSLSYVRPATGVKATNFMTVVNSAQNGQFVTSLEAMTELLDLPRSQIPANVQVTATPVASTFCSSQVHI